MTYQLFPNGVVPASKDTELRWLTQMGFNVAPWVSIASFKEAHTWYETYVSGARATLDFDIDGLVFDINDRSVREALGELNNRPKGSVAWKFPHESKATKLLDIEWQVGNSGRITPVAIFEPVTLAGASISRASLAGIRQVEHLKLYKGCNILVARRNDCIPRVESNLDLAIENDL
jgi:DNA ligase (NAD+)